MGSEKKGSNEIEILVEGENYRVTTITKFVGLEKNDQDIIVKFENLDTSEGLNIEEIDGDDNYIVINTLRWNEKEKDVCIENIGSRILTVLNYKNEDFNIKDYFNRIQEYLNCLEFARKVLIDIHNKDKEEEGYFITNENVEDRIFCYKGFEVKILADEAGQQFYFEFNGKEYNCGAFNPYPEEEIKWVIDRYLEENKKNVA